MEVSLFICGSFGQLRVLWALGQLLRTMSIPFTVMVWWSCVYTLLLLGGGFRVEPLPTSVGLHTPLHNCGQTAIHFAPVVCPKFHPSQLVRFVAVVHPQARISGLELFFCLGRPCCTLYRLFFFKTWM